MVSLAQRIKFAEEHVTTKDGYPFSFVGREWQLEDFWRPADGYKLWPKNPKRLCSDCQDELGEIVEWQPFLPSQTPEHARTKHCDGLQLEPILLTAINVPRQEGKTTGVAGYALSQAFQEPFRSILYAASAGDQADVLFEENFRKPIENNKRLSKSAHIVGHKVVVRRTRSTLEHVVTSHGSITGRGRTHIILDECRDIPARVAMAALPSIFAQGGLACPRRHSRRLFPDGFSLNAPPTKCPQPGCQEWLVPWYGRAIFLSTSGIEEDNPEYQWFNELVERLLAHPNPQAHVYRSSESTNPRKGEGRALTLMEAVFGQMESTKVYVEAEVHNRPQRKGEDFLSEAERRQLLDPTLKNSLGSTKLCVGFLDTSSVSDLTSLTILADDPPEDDSVYVPWSRLMQLRIDIWDPKEIGRIDETVMIPELAEILPRFPGLVRWAADARLRVWVRKMDKALKRLRREHPWGRKLELWEGRRAERQAAFLTLEDHAVAGTLKLIPHAQTKKELKGARRIRLSGSVEIRESSRKHNHLESLDGIAHCCLFAAEEQLKARSCGVRAVRKLEKEVELSRGWRPTVRFTEDDL